MTDLHLQARPQGDVEKTILCPMIRLAAPSPYGFHLRWMREAEVRGPAGATGFLLPPRCSAWIDVTLHGMFQVSLERVDSVARLRVRHTEDPGSLPLAVSVEATLLDCSGATPLQHALAGTHPIDRIRRLLPLIGSEDWCWLHESCGVPATFLESLQSALAEIPLEAEGLLWEVARDEAAMQSFLEWAALAASWRSRAEAWDDVQCALDSDPTFIHSAPFALLDSLGFLTPSTEPLPTPMLTAIRSLVHNPVHGAVLLRLHTLARRGQARLRGRIDFDPWKRLAEGACHAAPGALAGLIEADLSSPPAPNGLLFDAVAAEPALTELMWESIQADRPVSFQHDDYWRLTGPVARTLQRRRSVHLRLPWMNLRECNLQSRRCQDARFTPYGTGQLQVMLPLDEHQNRWAQFGAEVLSGPFSARDGMPVGGPDRLSWHRSFPLPAGRPPRFLNKLLTDYGFPEIPTLAEPATLGFEFAVRRELVEGCSSAPHSRDPQYATIVTRIARTLQWAMRRWVPFVYFLENPDLYSTRTVMPIMIYAASTPRALKKRREYGYEVINKTLVAAAIRSASPRLTEIYREFDPERITLENKHRAVLKSTSVSAAMNYVWRYPKHFEQLLHFDIFLIEQSINLLEAGRRLRAAMLEPPGSLGKVFQSEVEELARSVRHRLHRSLPADLDDYVPLLLIQAIAALHGEGLGADIPAATVTLRQNGKVRVFRNAATRVDDELAFDGLAIPAAIAS